MLGMNAGATNLIASEGIPPLRTPEDTCECGTGATGSVCGSDAASSHFDEVPMLLDYLLTSVLSNRKRDPLDVMISALSPQKF